MLAGFGLPGQLGIQSGSTTQKSLNAGAPSGSARLRDALKKEYNHYLRAPPGGRRHSLGDGMSDKQNKQQQQGGLRRDLLKSSLVMGGYAVTGALPFLSELALAQGEELVPFTDMPPEFSGPPKQPGGVFYQDTRHITDFFSRNEDQFYVVQHYNQPNIDEEQYRLRITGLVGKPLELSLTDIKQRPKAELVAGFECGGNNKNVYHGLIGNALWGGVNLRDLLREAEIQAEGTEVVFYGADKGAEQIRDVKVEQSFARSLHQLEVLDPGSEILLAYEMNGEPLPLFHGAPLRLIVPGWYGVANVKWLDQIHVQDRRFAGKYMARDYVTLSRREVGGEIRWEERLVTRMQLKSAITRVSRKGNTHIIRGFALNDGTPLRSVEVKIDDGPWEQARIDPDATPYSWKLFSYQWENPAAGEHSLISRVTDENGQVQATAEELPEKVSRWENPAQFPRTVIVS